MSARAPLTVEAKAAFPASKRPFSKGFFFDQGVDDPVQSLTGRCWIYRFIFFGGILKYVLIEKKVFVSVFT